MTDKSYSTKLAQPSPLFIGVDLGTSGCRAIAINRDGKIQAEAKIHYIDKNHKQQTPNDWWQATKIVIKEITKQVNHQHIQSIAVDGTSGSILFCDQSGHPLTPAVMYDEQHAKPQAHFLKSYAPKNSVVLNASSGLAKVLWLYEHHRPNGEFQIVHQADWIAGQLCQRFDFSDTNNALKTGYDPINKHWPLWLLDLFKELKINPNSLPKVVVPGTHISGIHPHIAGELNLPIDVEIIAGTTDSTAAFIASGANNVGQAVTSLGSTLVLKVISENEINDPQHGVYSQPFGKYWLVGGASNSGGAVLSYYFNEQEMIKLTEQLNPTTPTDLNYYPLITSGERFPINDLNLAPRVTPKAENNAIFFQGLLEGIADIEYSGYKLLEKLGAPFPSSIQSVGGGAHNEVWQQIRQNKIGVPISKSTQSAAAYGAAILASRNFIKREQA